MADAYRTALIIIQIMLTKYFVQHAREPYCLSSFILYCLLPLINFLIDFSAIIAQDR